MRAWLFVAMLGCGGGNLENPKPEIESLSPEKSVPEKVAVPVEQAGDGPREPVPVDLVFQRISKIHRGFFVQKQARKRLEKSLGNCFDDQVQVEVRYDNEALKGAIVLVMVPGAGRCDAVLDDTSVELQPWASIGKALADYRDYVAGTSDYRIMNFAVGIRLEHRDVDCEWWIGGQHPPDGSLWEPCVRMKNAKVCAGEASATRFDLSSFQDATDVRACFQGL